jgi:hypothetical protein
MADVPTGAQVDHQQMEIRIILDGIEPPTGQLYVSRTGAGGTGPVAQPIAFTGWLGLLRVLSDVVAGRETSRPPDAD